MSDFLKTTALTLAGPVTSSLLGSFWSNKASQKAYAEAEKRSNEARLSSLAAINTGTDQAVAQYQPYASGGLDANRLYDNAIGVNGLDAQRGYHEGFQRDPGYQATLDAGLEAVTQNRVARGSGNSGATQRDLFAFGQRQMSGQFNDRLDRLFNRGQQGFQASGQIAGLQANRGAQIAGIHQGTGSRLSDLAVGRGQTQVDGIQNSVRQGQQMFADLVGFGGRTAGNSAPVQQRSGGLFR